MSDIQHPSRRPEIEVLLSCARTRIEPDVAQRVTRALQDGIDWDYLIYEALYHGAAPLLYSNLDLLKTGVIPDTFLTQLKRAANAIACWNLFLTKELVNLLRLFDQLGLRALPFKGPVLAAAAYGNLSLRQFGDLDILMPREDIVKAKEVLIERGYRTDHELTPGAEAAYLQTHHDYKFTHGGHGAIVELQWGVTQWSFAFPLDFNELWNQREIVAVAGVAFHSLCADDLLLVLCVHGAKHCWERLQWVSDVAELLDNSNGRIRWHRVLDHARAQGGMRMLLLGVSLAHDLLGANLPDQVLKTIQCDSQIKALAGRVSEGLFREGSQTDYMRDEPPFFYWSIRERWRDKLAIARRYFPEYLHRMIVPNNRDRAFWELPVFLSLGYYLVRPVRLIKDYWSESRGGFGK